MKNTNAQKTLCNKIERLILFIEEKSKDRVFAVEHYKMYAETILILTEALKNVSESALDVEELNAQR